MLPRWQTGVGGVTGPTSLPGEASNVTLTL